MDRSAFRLEVRAWFEANCPTSLIGHAVTIWGGRKAPSDQPDERRWLERMAARGWTVPTWPIEYGGGGLDEEAASILREEMRRVGCPEPLFEFGVSLLGPILLEFGTEAQRREHLPKIARGEVRWCQGFSEPGAGSDLVALSCRAEREGDQYLVNGHKVWTSYGSYSDWIFCLVRTDSTATKHFGISFLLIDMSSPGVEVAPMNLISGSSRFAEVFLRDVRVPVTNRVGPEHSGWPIARRVLERERKAISEARAESILGEGAHRPLAELAAEYRGLVGGRLRDPIVRDEVARAEIDSLAYGAALRSEPQDCDAVGRASFLKFSGTELTQRRCHLRARLLGSRGIGWADGPFTAEEIGIARDWLWSRGYSLLGGSSEIQLNLIARRALGLPT